MKTEKSKSVPAAVIKSLDDLNPTFTLPVTIASRSENLEVKLECQALGKLEWADIRDEANDAAKVRSDERIEASTQEGNKLRIRNVVNDTMTAEANLVMKFATAWDFPDALTVENLVKLENKRGGSLGTIIGRYEIAIYQGRLGN